METIDDATGNGRSPRLTIREAADLAGVSTATVSRVINGRAEVSEKARRAVMRVVREHGYSTNRTARALSGGRTGLVGVTLPVVHHSSFSVILEESGEELSALPEPGSRFVIVDPYQPPDERVPTVSASHTSGASEAVEHLLSLGHRRIAAITGPRGWIATEERLRGYRAALAAVGVMPDPRLEVEAAFSNRGGLQATEALLGLPDPPTAIFAFNDMLAKIG